MRVFLISFSGANELIPKKDILDFLREHPLAEIGFVVSKDTDDDGFRYIMSVQSLIQQHYKPGAIGTIGLHVNGIGTDGKGGWPYRVLSCDIPKPLEQMMKFSNTSLQVNCSNYIDVIPPKAVDRFMQCPGTCMYISNCRTRIPYNSKTKTLVERIVDCGAKNPEVKRKCGLLRPDIIFDESFGEGVLPTKYEPPKFKNLRHIYAGGLSPQNIYDELSKIAEAQTDLGAVVGIDMERGVRADDGSTLDLHKAAEVYKYVMKWLEDNEH